MKALDRHTSMIGAVVATAAAVGTLIAPTGVHAEPQGYLPVEVGVGYVYGTFDQSPNVTLLVGGTAEEFCRDDPDDPFNAEPGNASLRLFLRRSGAVDLKMNAKDQPIYLYYQSDVVGPEWIEGVCADLFDEDPATTVPEPFASGTADLKVRISLISEDLVDVFNSVNGKASASDGTEYKVHASADLIVKNGVPVGDPAEFVRLRVTEVGG